MEGRVRSASQCESTKEVRESAEVTLRGNGTKKRDEVTDEL